LTASFPFAGGGSSYGSGTASSNGDSQAVRDEPDITTSHSTKLSKDDSKVAGYAHAAVIPRGHKGVPTLLSES
jgi:hypothetical protein